jgi:glutamate synthase domain-containing protein 3
LGFYEYVRPALRDAGFQYVGEILEELKRLAMKGQESRQFAIKTLSLLYDRIYDTGRKKRSSLLQLYHEALNDVFSSISQSSSDLYTRLDWKNKSRLVRPLFDEQALVIDTLEFPAEGEDSVARFVVYAYGQGWKNILLYNLRGHRFIGSGLGPRTNGLKIDCYGDVGDYVASGIDGCEITVHGAAQDQTAQILKYGKLVVHGDVGQAFMYAAKGGDVYVLGNAAGRPLINAVGRPRVVINGTCLDYLAESFMAGDPYNGGGFVVVNGLKPTFDGRFVEQEYPYPGSNLFSLASGGAIFIRDPYRKVSSEQLNGGRLSDINASDWALLLPHLRQNEKMFGISVERELLKIRGKPREPSQVYRKIEPISLQELA